MRWWRDVITVDLRRDHRRWINTGCEGSGPLALIEDVDLSGIRLSGATFEYSTFKKCSFSDTGIEYASFDRATFLECVTDSANLSHSGFNGAVFENCTFPRIDFRWGHFAGTRFRASTFDGSAFTNGGIVDAVIEDCSFRRARFDIQVDRSHLRGCDLREANFSGRPIVGHSYETHFENCDFRGADFSERRFRDTTFTRCKFAGVTGRAVLEGPVHVIEPDFSDAGDGSDIRSAEAVLAMWR